MWSWIKSLQSQLRAATRSPARQLFAKNLAVLSLGELLSRVITALAFIHLARVMDPASYGAVELTLAVMMFLTLMVDQGFGTLGAKEVARDYERGEAYLRRILSAQVLLAVAVFLLLAGLLLLIPIDPRLSLLLAGYGLSLIAYPFIIFWVFQGRDQMTWVAVPQFLRYAIFAVLAMVFVRGPEDILRLPVAEMFAMLTAAAVSILVFVRGGERFSLSLRAGLDRSLFTQAVPIGASQMIWALRMYLPTVLVGILSGQAAVGLYGVSHRIVMTTQTMLEVYFKNLFPALSQVAIESTRRLSALLYRSMLFLMIPSLLLAAAITLAAPGIIGLIFGSSYVQRDAVLVLQILIWILPILAWRRHGRNALIALDRQREELLCALAGVGVLVFIIVPLTVRYGASGTSVSMVSSELFAAGLAWWRVRHHLRTGTLARSQPPIAFPSSTKEGDSLTETFSQGAEAGVESPIFILGAPRSGTSLLRVMLNRHPNIAICDETYFMYYVYARRRAFGDLRDPGSRRRLISRYLATNRIQRLGVDTDALEAALMQAGADYRSLFLALIRFYAVAQRKTQFGDKTPDHTRYLPVLRAWYPNARLIYLVRDPRDVVASLMRMPWGSSSVLGNARTWQRLTPPPDRVASQPNSLIVRYEKLVTDPAGELGRVCQFLGEAFDPEMLTPGQRDSADRWWFQRSLGPVTKDRIGVWKKSLSPKQIALIERATGPRMEAHGYSTSGQKTPTVTWWAAVAGEYSSFMKDKLINLPRIWYHWFQPTALSKEEMWIDRRSQATSR